MPHRLAQQRMTLSDLEWPFHVSRAICAVAELIVVIVKTKMTMMILWGLTGESCDLITRWR